MNDVPTKTKKGTTLTFVTPDDLREFRLKLLEDIKQLLAEKYLEPLRRWIKGHEATRMLTMTPITLQRSRHQSFANEK